MKNKALSVKLLKFTGVILLFTLWDVLSLVLAARYGSDFALPGVYKTLVSLFELVKTTDYWLTILLSVLHILEGLAIGTLIGILLAFTVYLLPRSEYFLSPILTVIRSTPVVSFILILWVMLKNGKNIVPSLIAALMVVPVVYSQLHIGFQSLDIENMELLTLYGVKGKRKIKDFILPSLLPHFFSAFLTCGGLAWKAGVSAEVIVYAKNSIGAKISNAKSVVYDTPELFAWTLSVILLSVLFEKIILCMKKEVTKHEH